MASSIQDSVKIFISRAVTLVGSLGVQSCLAWSLGTDGRGLLFAILLGLIFVVGCDIASVYFVAAKRFSISEGVTYTLIYGGVGSGIAILVGLLVMQFPLVFLEKASSTSFFLLL